MSALAAATPRQPNSSPTALRYAEVMWGTCDHQSYTWCHTCAVVVTEPRQVSNGPRLMWLTMRPQAILRPLAVQISKGGSQSRLLGRETVARLSGPRVQSLHHFLHHHGFVLVDDREQLVAQGGVAPAETPVHHIDRTPLFRLARLVGLSQSLQRRRRPWCPLGCTIEDEPVGAHVRAQFTPTDKRLCDFGAARTEWL
jgi:hypothetical protein